MSAQTSQPSSTTTPPPSNNDPVLQNSSTSTQSQLEEAKEALNSSTSATAGLPEIALGTKVALRAVFGALHHPFTHVVFETDSHKKVEHDAWTELQYKGGKLTTE